MSPSLACLYDNGGEAVCGLRPREAGRGEGWVGVKLRPFYRWNLYLGYKRSGRRGLGGDAEKMYIIC